MKPSLLLSLMLLGHLVPRAAHAVKVAPQVVFIDEQSRGTELLLLNTSDAGASVEIEIKFGYEVTDEAGTVGTVYPEKSARSAASWIRAYPKRLRIGPKQQQVVRLFARPGADAAEGEYWARVAITSQPEQGPAKKAEEGKLAMEVGVTTKQIVPVFVRRGQPSATPKISKVRSKWIDGEKGKELEVLYFAEVSGGGAFLGQTKATLIAEGKPLGEHTKTLAIFEPGWRRISIPVSATSAKARLRLETVRNHPAIESKDLLPGENAVWDDAIGSP
jgi:P pilus assembly chaperone PapD